MQDYTIHTDLACEAEASHDGGKRGTAYAEEHIHGFSVARLTVQNETGAQTTGKRQGKYITIFTDLICDIDEKKFDQLTALIADEISALAQTLLQKTPTCVLVAGLGNREITADSIGPRTVDRLTVTRHIEQHNKKLFDSFCRVPLCAVAPGVLGQTGIETAEMIRGVCDHASPDLVIVIDALAARSTARLGATVQISDNGISPGSGIGNRRGEISQKALGVPVIAVGVPTVVNSATLVYDALQNAGYTEIDEKIRRVLHEGESFFVSPRQSDRISDRVSVLLSAALDSLFLY
ncbi:MAG: GPR endopeptidase [Clostridia bacterium]|nr:GPR endopeptidase [Clostridia bacterium]